ncbi:Uncharacterised protein [Mycobacteroides abscessus subsp. abscessus]|nr:Uncharacterised protein [Mycobacteroides abscessus subsp. abscessus]
MVPVPSVTTARIMGRSLSTTPGSSAGVGPVTVVGLPRMSCGTGRLPLLATVAATRLNPRGLTSTLP